jgi:hypothetical protein
MDTASTQPKVLVIGNDAMLLYLLNRFAEQMGMQLIQHAFAPWIGEIRQLKPAAIIFSSIDLLLTAQELVEHLSFRETLILVCASIADEVRAREAGADVCLLHPLTYENFSAALASIHPPGAH